MAGQYYFYMTCADCHRRQKVHRKQLNRRFRPQCYRCGGRLDMSDAGDTELARAHDAKNRRDHEQS